jgi:alkylation response protein AidB-like acyl-CoA dehydrogenase
MKGGDVMQFELQPSTDAGRAFVELAEKHAIEAQERVVEHDREATFPAEAIEAMKQSGFTKAPLPVEHGGLGLSSVHDLMIGMNRLARVDGGLAIAVNMHFTTVWATTRLWRAAVEAGDDEQRTTMEGFFALLAGGTIAMANATEPGTDLTSPFTTIEKVDGGWKINGTKIFSTLSPVADVFLVTVRERVSDGPDRGGFAIVFRGTPGQTVNDDWDALGMRSSGSGSVTYADCITPEALRLEATEWGTQDGMGLIIGSAGNLGLVASMLGIAEGAAAHVIDLVRSRKKGPAGRLLAERHGIQHATAELYASLATSRALLDRVGRLCDEVLVDRPVADVSLDDLHALNAEFQAAKLVSNRCAIDAVDKALQISGGQGYLASSPLSRAYRDVRAGPFMQIYSPNEAYEYVGKVVLGLPPDVDS